MSEQVKQRKPHDIFQELYGQFSGHYGELREDIRHCLGRLQEFPGCPFLHISNGDGSGMVMLLRVCDLHDDRDMAILQLMLCINSGFTLLGRVNPELVLYFDGGTIREVSTSDATELMKWYAQHMAEKVGADVFFTEV